MRPTTTMMPPLGRRPSTTNAYLHPIRTNASRYHRSARQGSILTLSGTSNTSTKHRSSTGEVDVLNGNAVKGNVVRGNASVSLIGRRHYSSSHEPQYDPPSGNLWGVKPGEKYEKEGWEDIFFYGFYGTLALAVVAYVYKPDTSIQTWALEEARRRLEIEGILEDPEARKPGGK